MLPSLVITISASRKSLAPARQALWRGCGLSLIGLAFTSLGLITFELTHNSPRPVVEGNIWDIREGSNRGSHSTRFIVTDAASHAVMIRCKHTGPYGAWHLRESPGENGCWGWVAIGLACGIAGVIQFAKAKRLRPTLVQ